MRNISLIFKQFSRSVLLFAGLALLGFSGYAQDAAKGEALFKANCTSCHKIDQKLTGPALGPATEAEKDDKFLTHWIQNNQALIAAKDPKAMKVYNDNGQAGMTVFATLSDGDVANILTYVRGEWKKIKETPPPSTATAAATDNGPSDLVIFGLIAVIIIAFLVILVLNKVIATLEGLLLKRQGLPVEVEVVEGPPVDKFALLKKLAKTRN